MESTILLSISAKGIVYIVAFSLIVIGFIVGACSSGKSERRDSIGRLLMKGEDSNKTGCLISVIMMVLGGLILYFMQ